VVPPNGNPMQWEYQSIPVNNLIPLTASMQLVVSIADYDPNVNITEVAFDEFYVTNNSVSELESNEQEFSLFPNPAQNTVTFRGLLTNEPFVVHDIQGKLVFQGKCQKENESIDVSAWYSGIYFVSAQGQVVKFCKE